MEALGEGGARLLQGVPSFSTLFIEDHAGLNHPPPPKPTTAEIPPQPPIYKFFFNTIYIASPLSKETTRSNAGTYFYAAYVQSFSCTRNAVV